jgi:hypothetical protein
VSDALAITGNDLVRTLGGAATLPAVGEAVKAKAEAMAERLAADGVTTRVLKRGAGAYSVEVSGEGLFEREFGAVGADARPDIATAIAEAKSA